MARLMDAGPGASEADLLQARPCGENRIALIITGMGSVEARKSARAALGLDPGTRDPVSPAQPDALLVVGLCGGLSTSLQEGDIVAYTDVGSTDPERPPLECSRDLRERIAHLLVSRGVPCKLVTGITCRRIAANREEKLTLAQGGASVVDMESYEVVSAGLEAGAPVAVVRVVSDRLEAAMPDFNGALTIAGNFKLGKAACIAVRHPFQTARLLRACRGALGRAGKALEIVVRSPVFKDLPSDSSRSRDDERR